MKKKTENATLLDFRTRKGQREQFAGVHAVLKDATINIVGMELNNY